MLTLAKEVAVLRRFVVCAGCGVRMSDRTDFDYDHEIPLALGGRDDADNLRPYCRATCHPSKTTRDIAAIAKAKRLAGETGAAPTRRTIPKRRDHAWPTRSLASRPMQAGMMPTRPMRERVSLNREDRAADARESQERTSEPDHG